MNEGLIPRRYAKALYEFALEKKADGRVYDIMKTLAGSFRQQPSLQEALGNPYVSVADKCMLITTASGAKDTDVVFADFLKLLSENRRLDMTRGIAEAFVQYYRSQHNIHEVTVVSAAPMSDTDVERLPGLVARHLNGGSMEFHQRVDASLIGGFTVSVGNERIDASISNELKQLRLKLLNNN